jgi:hypothetical protein
MQNFVYQCRPISLASRFLSIESRLHLESSWLASLIEIDTNSNHENPDLVQCPIAWQCTDRECNCKVQHVNVPCTKGAIAQTQICGATLRLSHMETVARMLARCGCPGHYYNTPPYCVTMHWSRVQLQSSTRQCSVHKGCNCANTNSWHNSETVAHGNCCKDVCSLWLSWPLLQHTTQLLCDNALVKSAIAKFTMSMFRSHRLRLRKHKFVAQL